MDITGPLFSGTKLDRPLTLDYESEPASFASLPLPSAPPVDGAPHVVRPVEPSAPFSLQSLESKLESLVNLLGRQLATLERTLTQAMAAITRGIETWGKSPHVASDFARARVNANDAGANTPSKYAALVSDAARRHELDPGLLTAVIRQESGFQPNAISDAGAMGLMQLMPETARSLGVRDPLNPAQNIEGGATLIRSLIDRYHGQLDLALAAYNAGSGAVDRYGGVPPYRETQDYVRNVLAMYRETALG